MGWIKNLGLGFIVGRILKGAAEGKYGHAVEYVYWHLRGIKTALGVALFIVAGFVSLLDRSGLCAWAVTHWAWFACAAWASTVAKWSAAVGTFWIWLGQQDGALHLDAPESLSADLDSFGKPRP